jgi:hypothetical protein
MSGSLTITGDHRLRLFENRVLRGMCGHKVEEVTGVAENCIMRSFITCTIYQILSE